MTLQELLRQHGITDAVDLAKHFQWRWEGLWRFWVGRERFAGPLLQRCAELFGESYQTWNDAYQAQRHGGHVYIVNYHGFQKIGHTRDLNARLRTLTSALPKADPTGISAHLGGRPSLLHAIATNDRLRLEHHLHARFAEYRTKGEWFQLPSHELTWLQSVRSCQFKSSAMLDEWGD